MKEDEGNDEGGKGEMKEEKGEQEERRRRKKGKEEEGGTGGESGSEVDGREEEIKAEKWK